MPSSLSSIWANALPLATLTLLVSTLMLYNQNRELRCQLAAAAMGLRDNDEIECRRRDDDPEDSDVPCWPQPQQQQQQHGQQEQPQLMSFLSGVAGEIDADTLNKLEQTAKQLEEKRQSQHDSATANTAQPE